MMAADVFCFRFCFSLGVLFVFFFIGHAYGVLAIPFGYGAFFYSGISGYEVLSFDSCCVSM